MVDYIESKSGRKLLDIQEDQEEQEIQEQEAREDKQKFELSQKALELLSEPMIEKFFVEGISDCQVAFETLPMGSSRDEYQTVHHDLLAMKRLKLYLEKHIKEYEIHKLMKDTEVEAV